MYPEIATMFLAVCITATLLALCTGLAVLMYFGHRLWQNRKKGLGVVDQITHWCGGFPSNQYDGPAAVLLAVSCSVMFCAADFVTNLLTYFPGQFGIH